MNIAIFIGEHFETPELDDFNFLFLGFQHKFILKKIEQIGLGKPYSTCQNVLDNSYDSDLFRKTFNHLGKYCQSSCFNFCFEKQISNECNYSITECYNSEQECCVSAYNSLNGNNCTSKCVCECPLQCQTVLNETIQKKNLISSSLNKKIGAHRNISKSLKVVVKIYYKELSYIKVKQVTIIDEVELLSNIGGVFGLFIGASLLTFMELLELFLRIVYICFKKLNRNK